MTIEVRTTAGEIINRIAVAELADAIAHPRQLPRLPMGLPRVCRTLWAQN